MRLYLHRLESFKFRKEVVFYSHKRALQGQSADQKNEEDDVGQSRRYPNSLVSYGIHNVCDECPGWKPCAQNKDFDFLVRIIDKYFNSGYFC